MWLYIPSHCLLESEGSISESVSPDEPELFATSSGKPTQRPLSWRGWKTRPWISRLSGIVLTPSTAARGAEEWISSLPVRHVSRTLSPAIGKETPTNDPTATATDRSPICSGSSTKLAPPWFSSRMSAPGSQMGIFETSESAYQRWVIESKDRSLLLRQVLERRIGGSGSLSWPTPRAEDSESSGARRSRGVADTLTAATRQWPTPAASNGQGGDNRTPTNGGRDLQYEAPRWPTPAARDYKGAGKKSYQERHNTTKGEHLPNYVEHCFRPDQATPTDGGDCSKPTKRLNPRFVEMLLGWPTGMTDCDAPVTELCHWRRLSRSIFYCLRQDYSGPDNSTVDP